MYEASAIGHQASLTGLNGVAGCGTLFGVKRAGDFCFVHCADLHLGARRWLATAPVDEGLREIVGAADRLALSNLVDLCLVEGASLLVCAGDIIDGWCRDHRVGLGLVHELLRLRPAGCDVALILGNHDVRTRIMRPLLLPEHCHVLGDGAVETRVVDRLGTALHGWSAPDVQGPCDVAALYPPPVPGLLNVGLLHTSAEGCRGHADYAPCSRRTLRSHGYDYWALGHVHARQVIADEPWIVFPGNLQGRGSREEGDKGATLVRVRDGRIVAVEHRALDAVRFETIVVDAEDAERFDDVLGAVAAAVAIRVAPVRATPVVASVRIRGVAAAAAALSRPPAARARAFSALARELSRPDLWIDAVWIDAGDELGAWAVPMAA